MSTPFDAAIAEIAKAGYHNHRLETHSDLVSDGIVADLQEACEVFRRDVESGGGAHLEKRRIPRRPRTAG